MTNVDNKMAMCSSYIALRYNYAATGNISGDQTGTTNKTAVKKNPPKCSKNYKCNRKGRTKKPSELPLQVQEHRKHISLLHRPVEPRRSWLLLFLCIVPVTACLGIDLYSFGIYYVEYCRYFDTTKSYAGMIIAAKMTTHEFCGLVGSACIKNYGCRSVALVGSGLLVLGTLTSALSPNILVLIITQGFVTGLGSGLSSLVCFVKVQQMFPNNRVLGAGIGMSGYSIGHVVGPAIAHWLIDKYGWRGSVLIQCALAAHMIPCSLALGSSSADSNKKCKSLPATRSHLGQLLRDLCDFTLLRYRPFALFVFCGFLHKCYSFAAIQHFPNRTVSIGYTTEEAAFLMTIFGLVTIVAKFGSTAIGNLQTVNTLVYFAIGDVAGVLAVIVLVIWHSLPGQVLGAVWMGIHLGMTNTVLSVTVVQLVGVDKLPRALALYLSAYGLASFLSTPFSGWMYDLTNSYDIAYLVIGGLCLLAASLTFVVASLDRKYQTNKEIEQCAKI